jgi:hypothetical protein
MNKSLFKGILAASAAIILILGITLSGLSAEAQPIDVTEYGLVQINETETYDLADMLTLALEDEYAAQAVYNLILETYGDIRPFNRIVKAEQTHIDLLLPLFEAYGIAIPENTAADTAILPESVEAAIALGVEAETANIAMYEAFLSDDTLPDDVRVVFERLLNASQKHLNAFQKDRALGICQGIANQFKGQGKANEGNGFFQNRGGNASGRGQGQGSRTQNQSGVCTNPIR